MKANLARPGLLLSALLLLAGCQRTYFWAINAMHHWDTEGRNGLPLGDEAWMGKLLKAEGIEIGKFSV